MRKTLFILGQPRTGKSSVAADIEDYLGKVNLKYKHVCLDSIRDSFDELLLEKVNIPNETGVRDSIQEFYNDFVSGYVRSAKWHSPDDLVIVEGHQLPVTYVKYKYPNDIIICLGVSGTAEDFASALIEGKGALGEKPNWLSKMDDKSILEVAKRVVKYSAYNKEMAKQLGIPYFECSGYRTEEYMTEIFNFIVNKLETESTYE